MLWGGFAGPEKGPYLFFGEGVGIYQLPKILQENSSPLARLGVDNALDLRNAEQCSHSRSSKYSGRYEPEAHSIDLLASQLN
ncbi:Bgt-50508 [Blumeria graminis f. sp. tritici]|uniref:Bgt-50508 n=1 Tax=Blumeria graminis f. sp. tritici TaxID=62690 RepID=A0A9X9PSA3_BLUGR|nr:Bgt-50508 [Blumeria graminis f. sp. tritici]